MQFPNITFLTHVSFTSGTVIELLLGVNPLLCGPNRREVAKSICNTTLSMPGEIEAHSHCVCEHLWLFLVPCLGFLNVLISNQLAIYKWIFHTDLWPFSLCSSLGWWLWMKCKHIIQRVSAKDSCLLAPSLLYSLGTSMSDLILQKPHWLFPPAELIRHWVIGSLVCYRALHLQSKAMSIETAQVWIQSEFSFISIYVLAPDEENFWREFV